MTRNRRARTWRGMAALSKHRQRPRRFARPRLSCAGQESGTPGSERDVRPPGHGGVARRATQNGGRSVPSGDGKRSLAMVPLEMIGVHLRSTREGVDVCRDLAYAALAGYFSRPRRWICELARAAIHSQNQKPYSDGAYTPRSVDICGLDSISLCEPDSTDSR